MLLRLNAYCCVCKTEFDWHARYGRDGCCCSKQCYGDFNLRYAISLGIQRPTPGATVVTSKKPARRTKAEVLAERATVGGCCNRHADNKACDCLEEASGAETPYTCKRCKSHNISRQPDPSGGNDSAFTCLDCGKEW